MRLPLKLEEQFESEKLIQEKEHQRRVNISQETPWIVQQQRICKTKGHISFGKQLDRSRRSIYSSSELLCKNEDRFEMREIPKVSSKFTNAGQAVIPYSKMSKGKKGCMIPEFATIGENERRHHSEARLSNKNYASVKVIGDNIDTLASACSKNKLLNLFVKKSEFDKLDESPRRLDVNNRVKDLLLNPRDRFSSTPRKNKHGYTINYDLEKDRFPKGVDTLNRNRKSYFRVKSLEEMSVIDKAIYGIRNSNFKIRKDSLYFKSQKSHLPRFLI